MTAKTGGVGRQRYAIEVGDRSASSAEPGLRGILGDDALAAGRRLRVP